jgi:hypothetical protein
MAMLPFIGYHTGDYLRHWTEIAKHSADAARLKAIFQVNGFRRGDQRQPLLAYAVGSHARPEILALIQSLPDKVYPSLRNLWHDLGNLPIGG